MADGGKMETVTFTLDGREVTARPGESIWQVAKREGTLDAALQRLRTALSARSPG